MIALSAWVIYLSFSLKGSLITYDIGPAVYPRLICWIIIALSLLLVVIECLIKKENYPVTFLNWKNVLHIGMILVFMLLMQRVGFPICAFVIIAIMMKIMGCPRIWQMLAFSAVASAALYLIFSQLLRVRLPLGILNAIF